MASFTLSLQTAYVELLDAHQQHALTHIGGRPFLKTVGDKGAYWYTRQRLGDRVVDRYLGKDTPDLRARLDKVRADLDTAKRFEERSASLVAQLRAGGMPALDRDSGKVLNAMARIGVFRLGGTLIGTHAYRLMSAGLGTRLDASAAVTEDLDIAAFGHLKLVIQDRVDPSLADTLGELRLEPLPSLTDTRPTRWHLPGGGTRIDFLTPKRTSSEVPVHLEPLGIYAQPLPFLNFLIAEPIAAVGLYRSGVLVQIPRPERYAIHKLIVAQRRRDDPSKTLKDLAQAQALIAVLSEDRPWDLKQAWTTALEQGPKWQEAIDRSLHLRPAIRERLESL